MSRTADYSDQACAVAAALQVVGEPWTLLIVRDALRGRRRFEQFQTSLGCARNVLAARLKTLVADGLLVRRAYCKRPPRFEYVPTDKARDLFPVIAALLAWGDRHVYDGAAPATLRHTCGAAITSALACEACGVSVGTRDVRLERAEGAATVGQALARGTKPAS